MKFLLPLVLLPMLFLVNCAPPETDEESPEIDASGFSDQFTSAEVCGETSDRVIVLDNGSELSLVLGLSDDDALAQLKWEIHENFDCHGHSHKTVIWEESEIVDLSGNSQDFSRSIEVPDNPGAGFYHLNVYLLDDAGNEATPFHCDLFVRNLNDTIAPVISSSNLPEDEQAFKPGDKIIFDLDVQDDQPLADDVARIEVKLVEHASGHTEHRLTSLLGSSETNLSREISFELPADLETGEFELVIIAYDSVNNASNELELHIEIE